MKKTSKTPHKKRKNKIKENNCYCIMIPFTSLKCAKEAISGLNWAYKVLKLKDKDYYKMIDKFMIQVQGGKS